MTKAIDPVIRERTKEVKKLLEELELVGFLEPGRIPPWMNKLTHQRAEHGHWEELKGCFRLWLNVRSATSRYAMIEALGLDPKDLGDPRDKERREAYRAKHDRTRRKLENDPDKK